MECCNSLQDSNSPAIEQLASLLGISIPPGGQVGQVGLACAFPQKHLKEILTKYYTGSTMTVSDNTCDRQPACCTGYNGKVRIEPTLFWKETV